MADPDPTAEGGQQPTALSVTVDKSDGATNVSVRGEIDLETTAQLSDVLAGLEGDSRVRIDLGEVTYIDSTGLRALLTARDAAAKAGGSLSVSTTSSIVARLIEITGATDLLDT